MGAQQLVLRQRAELVQILCSSGASESLESVLDLLLATGVLVWEDYQTVRVPSRTLCSNVRELLDLVYTKGEEACKLLLASIRQVLPEVQRAGLCFGHCDSDLEQSRKKPDSAAQILLSERPGLVKRLRDCIEGALRILLEVGSFTVRDCDEVQLCVHTPSQQVSRQDGGGVSL